MQDEHALRRSLAWCIRSNTVQYVLGVMLGGGDKSSQAADIAAAKRLAAILED